MADSAGCSGRAARESDAPAITEDKAARAEAALGANQRLVKERERLAVTLQCIGDAVIATDAAGRVAMMNEVAEALTGWSSADALGSPIGEVMRTAARGPGPLSELIEPLLRGATGTARDGELLLLSRDGRERPVAVSCTPMRPADGAVAGVVLVLRDQTHERQLNEALHKSEALLRIFSDAMPDSLFVKDRQGRWLFANRASLRSTGKTAAQAIGATDAEIWDDPALAARLVAADRRIMESGVAESIEETIQTPEGERTYLTTKFPFRERDGSVIGICGASRDITERKRVEEALREREYLLSESQRIAHIGTWSWDLASGAMRWSAETYRLFGTSEETFTPTPGASLSLVHPDDREALSLRVPGISAGGRLEPFTFRVLHPDGSTRFLQMRGEHLGSDPSRRRITGTIQDVTERHLAEGRLRALIENGNDIIMVIDAASRVTFWSESGTERLGWTAEELVGESRLKLLHPDDRAESQRLFAELLAEPEGALRLVRRYLHKNGSSRTMEVTVQNRLLDPAVKGLVVNLRDITAEQHLGDQLRQSQKLEAIGRLTGGIAHDFNNVLTVILSHAAYLLEDLPMPDPRRRDAEGIRAAAERAASLTRQLLAFARKQVLAPRVLDLNQVIAGLAPMLRRVIGEDILLSIDAAPQLGATRADAGQLEQVILNLAVNARDAMPTGGRFSLATSEITLDAGQLLAHPGCAPGRYVALTVRDTGAGMSAEVQQHLFEPFFTTKEQGKGTGLGLSTVLGIVEQSGGLVLVESGPGRGATFRIYLPRVDASPELVEPGPGPRTLRGHETILVVDDDEQVRRTAARILSSRGYRVLMAPSAREALAVVEDSACAVELVISDIVMPGQSGPELLEQLRARCPSLRVLFMSGFTEHAVVEKTLAAGADYLQKPFTPDTLAQRTRAILDRPAPVAR